MADEPPRRHPGNYVGGEWDQVKDVQELAYAIRINAELAHLAYRGLRDFAADVGEPDDEIYELVQSLIFGVANGTVMLERALSKSDAEDQQTPPPGVTDMKTALERRRAKRKDGV